MVDRDWLYRLGRIIPEYMLDELEAMESKREVLDIVQSLPMGKMEGYDESFAKLQASMKKAAPKKKAAKKTSGMVD